MPSPNCCLASAGSVIAILFPYNGRSPMGAEDNNVIPVSAAAVDTIAAVSTPPGRGGIGIVRLSGLQSASIASQLVSLRQPLEHARARLADVLDEPTANGERIDEAVVTSFSAPNSSTSREVGGIAGHGSPR